MVKLKSCIESRCMAMELALCLLVGLQLVKAQLQGSTCDLGHKLTSSSQRDSREHQHQHRIAPPSTKWSVDLDDSMNSMPKVKRRNSTDEAAASAVMPPQGAAAGDTSVTSKRQEACPSGTEERHGIKSWSSCPPPAITADFAVDDGSSSSPDTSCRQDSSSKTSNGGSSACLTPSSTIFSDMSDNINSTLGSSSSSSPLSSPTMDSDSSPSSLSGSLPDINLGDPDSASNSNSNLNQTNISSDSSGNMGTPPSPSQSKSKSDAAAVAAGVTVPVGVIALGLAALFILHKQKQRRQGVSATSESIQGQRDEELADSPAVQCPEKGTPNDGNAAANLTASTRLKNTSPPQPQVESQIWTESAEGTSDGSHLTESSHAADAVSAPCTTQVRESPKGSVSSSPQAVSIGAARAKSLKRKPVPAFIVRDSGEGAR
ncbi:uncharacterized protein MEPE_03183 [Melanopsichium pennsylvanicum]|uniref:Uncharacterized protein n=2 Tax=Melanopsichium pennsylvanicum TaxID=63383 RepID=A0AAJ4XKJ3_9BASI|nr:uncharacterized protein BN887_01331 [Melanopsichium pennsylvanicum 4]SNX84474.1 uncharacterized protein MEPE_03183 [Melanopsichium pennsylvanicum]